MRREGSGEEKGGGYDQPSESGHIGEIEQTFYTPGGQAFACCFLYERERKEKAKA
jgi:hypothetical protein